MALGRMAGRLGEWCLVKVLWVRAGFVVLRLDRPRKAVHGIGARRAEARFAFGVVMSRMRQVVEREDECVGGISASWVDGMNERGRGARRASAMDVRSGGGGIGGGSGPSVRADRSEGRRVELGGDPPSFMMRPGAHG
jgi:hypothetical protein